MVNLYKDLGKTAKKLLNDDFIYGGKKVELKTKTEAGMTYTVKGAQDAGKGDAISGDLSCKYAVSGATLTTKMLTSGQLSQEVCFENTGVKGLKLTLLGGLGSKQVINGSAEYMHPHMSYTAAVNALGAPSIISSLAVGTSGFTVGVDGEYDVESKLLKKVDGVVNYNDGKENEATIMALSKASKFKFSYSHIVSQDFAVAAEFLYDKAAESKLLTMGTRYEVDRDTTLKTRIDSAGAIAISYIQEIRKGTKLTLCSRFDVRNIEKTSHKFGLSLVIE